VSFRKTGVDAAARVRTLRERRKIVAAHGRAGSVRRRIFYISPEDIDRLVDFSREARDLPAFLAIQACFRSGISVYFLRGWTKPPR